MGIGPAFAIRQLLEKNSLSLDHIDLVEVGTISTVYNSLCVFNSLHASCAVEYTFQ